MNFKQFFHIHKWTEYQFPPEYCYSESARRLALIPGKNRVCFECGRIEREEKHCLGLNPLKYISKWQFENYIKK